MKQTMSIQSIIHRVLKTGSLTPSTAQQIGDLWQSGDYTPDDIEALRVLSNALIESIVAFDPEALSIAATWL